MTDKRAVRHMTIDGLLLREADDEQRTVPVTVSSEHPVSRMDWTTGERYEEVLSHADGAVDMSRAPLPLIEAHDNRTVNIGLVESMALTDDGRLRGLLRLGTQARAAELWSDIKAGIVRNVSVGYEILGEFAIEGGRMLVEAWRPYEVSLVAAGADPTAGINRAHGAPTNGGSRMDANNDTGSTPEPTGTTDDSGSQVLTGVLERVDATRQRGRQEGQRLERQRIADIDGLVAQVSTALPQYEDEVRALAEDCKTRGATPDNFRTLVFDLMATQSQPYEALAAEPPAPALPGMGSHTAAPGGGTSRGMVRAGPDGRDKAARGIEAALQERAGCKVDESALKGNQYRGWSILDCAREILRHHGVDTRGWSSERVAKAAINMRAISPGTAAYVTADFPAVTANVATKRVFDGFAEADRTWDVWASTTEVPDFKQFDIPRISQIQTLPTVAENAAYANLTQADAREQATLIKKGGLISFSWEAMVNDDQRMFSQTAFRLGESAQRTLDIEVYSVLTTNANMGDGNPLFDATHSNTGTAALDKDGVIAARTAMGRQTDENSIVLGVRLNYILVPLELQEEATQLASSDNLPILYRDTSGTATDMALAASVERNTLRGTFTPVSTARLTDATDWYAAAAMGQTVEVAFLTGNRQPALEQDMGWDTDAMHFKVRFPFIAYPVDWRGLYRNVVAG